MEIRIKEHLLKTIISNKISEKTAILTFAFLALFFLNSCNKDTTEISNSKVEKGELAVEIFTHSQCVDKIELLNETKHLDFISPEIILMVQSNKQAMMRISKSSTNEIDTLFSLEEIPIYKEKVSTTRIYSSGTMESESEDITPDNMNPINTFTANPLPAEATIRKTVQEDGLIKSYNGEGKLIQSVPYEEQNMKSFLDTLKYYVAITEDSIALQQVKSSQSQLRKIKQQSISNGLKIIELSNGNIVLEQLIESGSISNSIKIKSSQSPLRSRTELNAEMNKTIKFEILQGDQLLLRRSYFYSNKDALKNSKYTLNIPKENPELIKSEALFFNNKNIPMIKSTQEYYLRNQMVFHF
ncbi:MAG: hypothetical protein PHH37_12860 [Paludibacter sp.]|nr:hypothetical protein [Paludibacter sp.]